jgi:hypothetical protein
LEPFSKKEEKEEEVGGSGSSREVLEQKSYQSHARLHTISS